MKSGREGRRVHSVRNFEKFSWFSRGWSPRSLNDVGTNLTGGVSGRVEGRRHGLVFTDGADGVPVFVTCGENVMRNGRWEELEREVTPDGRRYNV